MVIEQKNRLSCLTTSEFSKKEGGVVIKKGLDYTQGKQPICNFSNVSARCIKLFFTLLNKFLIVALIFCTASNAMGQEVLNLSQIKHPLDFHFVWDNNFTTNIPSKYFNGKNFGPEGDIRKNYQWKRKIVSYIELKQMVVSAAQCIDPRIAKGIVNSAKGTLLEDTLGLQEKYNVNDSLDYLRSINTASKSSGQKLLQRVLSLISYDILDKKSVKGQNLVRIYDDLNITDPNILPEGRQSETTNFVSFCIYQDSNRRIRIHYLTPKKDRAEFPHNHYGDSGSILLAGSLVNQHLAVFPTKYDQNADFGLYALGKEDHNGDVRKSRKVSFFEMNVKLSVISSHLYRTGDHYLLPGPRKIEDKSSVNDILTFHRVDTENFTVTLFAQMLGDGSSHTTNSIGAPTIIYKRYDESPILSVKSARSLISKIDKIIKETWTTKQ